MTTALIHFAEKVLSPTIIGSSITIGVDINPYLSGYTTLGPFEVTSLDSTGLIATITSSDSIQNILELGLYKTAMFVINSLPVKVTIPFFVELHMEGGDTFSSPEHPNASAADYTSPDPTSAPKYTYNKVDQTISGHVREVDDTPGMERIRESHRIGSGYEIRPDGSRVTKIVGDNYDVYLSDHHVYINGNCNITVMGDANIMANNMNLTATKTFNLRATDINFQAENSITIFAAGSTQDSPGNINIKSLKDINIESEQKTLLYSKDDLAIISDASIFNQSADFYDVISGSNLNIVSLGISYIDGTEVRYGENTQSATAPEITKINTPNKSVLPILDDSDISKIGGANKIALVTGHSQSLNDDEDNSVSKGKSENNVNIGAPITSAPLHKDDMTEKNVIVPKSKPITTTPHVGTFSYTDTGDRTNPNDWAGVDYETVVLSPNFTLAHLTTKTLLQKTKLLVQNGKDKNAMAGNLQALAINVLEPLRVKYPGFRINSGFRPGSGSSQHKLGMAADLQFPGKTNKECLEIANWCIQNLPVDQVILEHGNGIWIHVSHNSAGTQRKQALSWKAGYFKPRIGKEYANGFILLAPETQLSTNSVAGETVFV
jgi:hypothetical protein